MPKEDAWITALHAIHLFVKKAHPKQLGWLRAWNCLGPTSFFSVHSQSLGWLAQVQCFVLQRRGVRCTSHLQASPAFNLIKGIKLFMLVILPSPACPILCLKTWLSAAKLPHVFIRTKMHRACHMITKAFTFVRRIDRLAKYAPECSYCVFWGTVSFCRTHKMCTAAVADLHRDEWHLKAYLDAAALPGKQVQRHPALSGGYSYVRPCWIDDWVPVLAPTYYKELFLPQGSNLLKHIRHISHWRDEKKTFTPFFLQNTTLCHLWKELYCTCGPWQIWTEENRNDSLRCLYKHTLTLHVQGFSWTPKPGLYQMAWIAISRYCAAFLLCFLSVKVVKCLVHFCLLYRKTGSSGKKFWIFLSRSDGVLCQFSICMCWWIFLIQIAAWKDIEQKAN